MVSHTTSQTVRLGPDGPTIPALGVGTWSWGDSLFWQYGKAYGLDEVRAAFDASLAAGVTFFDTAEVYGLGESERILGQFLQATPSATDQPIVVATKYFPLPWRIWQQSVADTLTASLQRLQVASIGLYQVHWPFDFLMGQKTLMMALAQEVKQGRIQAVGVSNYSAQQMKVAQGYLAEQGVPLAVNQVQYSLLYRNIETNGVLETARELGVTILAYSPLAQGLLTGKYTLETARKPTGARRLDPRFSQQGLQKLQPLLEALTQIGEAYGKLPAQVALNWLITQGNVVPIPGAKNALQATQNAGALGWEMSEADLNLLANID